MIRRRGVRAAVGVGVSSWLDAPAALTSIQKQVSKDLTGQGQGVGGGYHCSVELWVCVRFICCPHPAGWLADWPTVCICCLCVCLFYKLLLIASLWGQLELRSRGTQPPPFSLPLASLQSALSQIEPEISPAAPSPLWSNNPQRNAVKPSQTL